MFCGHCGAAVDGAKFCPNCGQPVEGRHRRSLLVALVGAAVAVLVVGVILTVALLGSTTTHSAGHVTTITATSTPSIPIVSKTEAEALAQRYAAAWSATRTEPLGALLSGAYVGTEGYGPPEDRAQALAAYERAFNSLTDPRYQLGDMVITTGPGVATVKATYRLTTSSGTTTGRIVFKMDMTEGRLLITRIDEKTVGVTPAPSKHYADTCTVKAWYSNYSSATYGYIHFKCVDDASGTTVAEALGSDSFNFDEEQAAAKQTPKREELLDQLKSKLEGEGWTDIGKASGGEWYQLRFGRQ